VSLKTALFSKRLLIVATNIRRFARVKIALVDVEKAARRELPVTHVAPVWPFTPVNKFVHFQSGVLSERLLAQITFVRPFARVCIPVYPQLDALNKSLVTHVTLVRFFARVDAHVQLQTRKRSKSLLTHVAFVRFVACM